MKRNLDKPDYRSMNEAKLKLELAGLEQRILGITGDPLDYQHYRRFLDWSRNEVKVNEIEELMSDRCLILNLLFGYHFSLLSGYSLNGTRFKHHAPADVVGRRALPRVKLLVSVWPLLSIERHFTANTLRDAIDEEFHLVSIVVIGPHINGFTLFPIPMRIEV